MGECVYGYEREYFTRGYRAVQVLKIETLCNVVEKNSREIIRYGTRERYVYRLRKILT